MKESNENERYQKLLRNTERLAGVGGWIWEVKSDKWIMSDNWMALHGCSGKSFTTDDLLQIAHPEDAEKIKEAFTKTVTKGEPYQIEHRIVRMDNGEVRYIRAFGNAEPDADGNVELVSGAALDITDKVLAESKEKKVLQNLQSLLKLTTIEKKDLKKLSGFVLQEITDISDSPFAFYGFMDKHERKMNIYSWSENAMKECEIENKSYEFPIRNAGIWADAVRKRKTIVLNNYTDNIPDKKGVPDGHVAIQRLIAIPVFSKGKIVALAAAANKSTDYSDEDVAILETFLNNAQIVANQLQIEESLKESKKRLKLRKNIAKAFVLKEKDEIYHNVLQVLLHHFNSKFGFFGHINDKGDLVCPSMTYDIWNNCDVENKNVVFPKANWAGLWGKSLKTKTNLIKNSNLKVPGGHVQLKNAMVGVIQFQGKLIGQLAFANREQEYTQEDLKSLKEICRYIAPLLNSVMNEELHKKELIEAKEKAEESDRLKSAFLANMSHEIRTPMNGILGFTNLLKEPNLTGEEQKQFIDIIQKSGNRMLNTVNDLIDISRIESGQVQVTTEQTDICHEIESLFTFFKPEAEQKGLQFTFDKNLPNSESGIMTDKVKFTSIITNLIKNALKFTDEGSVKMGCEKKDGSFLFHIKDTGIGIPENRQKAIFNRFEQADIEDTMAFEGSGLGLSITKAYIEMLGGKIEVESEEGVGSIFWFKLPLSVTGKNDVKFSDEKPETAASEPLKNLKILIAEDDETSSRHLSIVLRKLKPELLYSTTGRETIELCKKHQDIDVILMDVKMPDINGYDATRKIREFNNKVIIIAQTAYALTGERDKALAAGCNDYISKPINMGALLEKISAYFKM